MKNYAVVNENNEIISWHEDGNEAIINRDLYDKFHGMPRFTSRVLTSGQVEQYLA